ncbi:KH domain-containing protein [Haliovirga abyssi]|uniref:RNA-binding protein KhpA n=1 Tax=Haliovirga abyssi TaxID=2996794 RepID=A0AAU9DB99_9FUSO|nr:KH domain-containing protein [Haliovirga abyssi]BDU50530.1 UPF0109 protein [Haliovirga abyssi]
MEKLEKLLYFIVSELVEDTDSIKIKSIKKGKNIILKLRVGDGELGKTIGKNGITASAIRGVVQAAAVKDKLNVDVEFLD